MGGEDHRPDDELDDETRLPDEWETRLPGEAETRLPGEEETRLVRDPETLPPLPEYVDGDEYEEYDDAAPADPITVLPLADDDQPAEPETVLPLPDSFAPGDAKERILKTAFGESAVTHDVDPEEVLAAIEPTERPPPAQQRRKQDGPKRSLGIVVLLLVGVVLAAGGWFVLGRGGGDDPPSDPPGDVPTDIDRPPPADDDPPVVPPAVTTGGLAVSSEPADATVFVDGKEVGVTPLSLDDLAPGERTVRIVLPFHAEWTRQATVEAGEEATVTAKLARGTATLTVRGARAGAVVSLRRSGDPPKTYREPVGGDGALAGFELEAGEYRMEVSLADHAPFSEVVRIDTGADVTRSVTLAPIESVLSVSSIPLGATVHLDGRELGSTPLDAASVPAGTYTLRLTAPEHEPLEQEVTIRAGTPLSLDGLRLPAWPRLDVSALDKGVTVFRDGEELRPAQRVRPGTFDVELRQKGYAPQTVTVTAEIGTNLKVVANDWSAYQAELDVSDVANDVTVLLDGEELFGSKTYPAATRVTLRLTRAGYADQVHEIDLELGKTHRLVARTWEPLLGTIALALEAGVIATLDGKSIADGDRLTPGRYTVLFTRDGFIAQSKDVEVVAGKTLRVTGPAPDAWERVPLTAEERRALLTNRDRWNATEPAERDQVLRALAESNRDFAFVDVGTATSGGVTNVVARFRHRKTGLVFALLPGGTFRVGREGMKDATPGTVTLSEPFFISTTELPQRVWTATGRENTSENEGDELPLENVDWYEATKFCTSLGWALPTEAQWEYAAAAGTTSLHSFGDGEADEHAWYFRNSGPRTRDVGTRASNAFGLFDVHGNVREWCRDVMAAYPAAPRVDPTGPDPPGYRVVRGGGCRSELANLATSLRDSAEPRERSPSLGFRPVAPVRF